MSFVGRGGSWSTSMWRPVWKISGYHPATDSTGLRVTGRANTRFPSTISGVSAFGMRRVMLSMSRLLTITEERAE